MSASCTELAALQQEPISASTVQQSKVGVRSRNSDTSPPTPNSLAIDEGLDPLSSSLQEFSLPPVDRGKDAWLFLAACFVMEALIWGM